MIASRERQGDVSRGATEGLLAQPRPTSHRLRHRVMSAPYHALTAPPIPCIILPVSGDAMAPDPTEKNKRGPGRPPRPLPERVPATPEELARVLVTTPPKKEWVDHNNGGTR